MKVKVGSSLKMSRLQVEKSYSTIHCLNGVAIEVVLVIHNQLVWI